jgi:hypothetical protein
VILQLNVFSEVTLQPTPAVIYRTTGGVLDFYLVLADNPEMVTSRYTQVSSPVLSKKKFNCVENTDEVS